MLVQNFFHYAYLIFMTGLGSAAGMLAVALLICSIALLLVPALQDIKARQAIFWALLLAGCALLTVSFYSAEYDFDEQPESLALDSLPSGEPECGTGTTGWIKAGYGIGNPCPAGCYRGHVVRKTMRLRGFPPWPEYRREMQCWAR